MYIGRDFKFALIYGIIIKSQDIKAKMINILKKILIETKKQFEIIDITSHVQGTVAESKIKSGIAVISD